MRGLAIKVTLLACGIILSTAPVIAAAQAASLESVPCNTIKVQQLDWKLIPASVPPSIQDQHVFTLRAPGMPNLTIVPVIFGTLYSPYVGNSCGAYLLTSGSQDAFVAMSERDEPVLCEGIRAIGLAPDHGPRPRLILVYKAVRSQGNSVPFILSWSASENVYRLDQSETDWLSDQNIEIYTITSARRLVLKRFPRQ